MSLSLIPSADRLAADGRVSNHAVTAKKGESPDSGTQGSEFALLVDGTTAIQPRSVPTSRHAVASTATEAADIATEGVSLADDPPADIFADVAQPAPSFPTIGVPVIAVPSVQNLPNVPLVDSPNSDPANAIDLLPTGARLNSFASDLPDLRAEPGSDVQPFRTADVADPTKPLALADQTGRPAVADTVFAVPAVSAPAIDVAARPAPVFSGPTGPGPAAEDQKLPQTALLTRAMPTFQITEPGASSGGSIDPTIQSSQAANLGGAEPPQFETAPNSRHMGIIAKTAERPDRQPATPGSMAADDPAVLTTLSPATAATTDPSVALSQSARNPQLFAAYSALTKPGQPTTEAKSDKALVPNAFPGVEAKVTVHPTGTVGPNGPAAGTPTLSRQTPQATVDAPTPSRPEVQSSTARPIDQSLQPVDRVMATVTAEALIPDSFGTTQILSELQRRDAGLRASDTPHGSRATAAHIASQVAQAASQTTSGTTDITLNPKELGHVKLSLQAVDGTLYVAIAAERPEIADLMRRHIDSLAQEFRGLGYQDVSFSFGGRQGGHGTGPDPGSGQSGYPEPAQPTETSTDIPADRYIPRRAAAQTGGTGLDLRL